MCLAGEKSCAKKDSLLTSFTNYFLWFFYSYDSSDNENKEEHSYFLLFLKESQKLKPYSKQVVQLMIIHVSPHISTGV